MFRVTASRSMSGYKRTSAGKVVFDWYKILQISPSSTPNEIKTAYYKIAQSAHPDKHNGCSQKLEQFKRINEAYDILSNPTKRNEYDVQMGHHHHHHRKTSYQRRSNIPRDYRKVYTSRPPPEWKMVWDHTKHYEMHYGDGFQKEAMKQAIKTAEQDGTFIYHSSLGKGFTFHHLQDRSTSSTNMNGSTNASTNHGATTNSTNYNPYSKNKVQGPSKIIFDYQEVTQTYGGDGSSSGRRKNREGVTKHERIVYDLHLRRYERYREEVRNESQQQHHGPSTTSTSSHQTAGGTTTNGTPNATPASTSIKSKSSIYSRYDYMYQQAQQQQQQESRSSSFNVFSTFMTSNTDQSGDNNTAAAITTTVESNHRQDQPVDCPTNKSHNTQQQQQQQQKGMTESSATNSSCTIM